MATKNILNFFLISIFILSSSHMVLQAQSGNQEDTHFKRTNLLVSDLDKSLEIYRDILGFSIHKLSESSKDSYSYPVFNIPRNAKMRFCTLDSPDQIRTMALTEVKGVELPSLPNRPMMSASVIRVKNLSDVIEKIQSLGLQTTEPKVATGSDDGTFTEQAFVDYDGHLIVIYEFQK